MTSANVYIGTSLDGFIARNDGDIDWLVKFANKDAVDAYDEFMSSIDAIVIGRGTLDKVLEFQEWPYDKPVFVLSRSLKEVPKHVNDKATILSLPPAELLQHLSKKGLMSAYVDGGKVIQSFLAEDLIENFVVATIPVLIGSGIPLFGKLDKDMAFELVRSANFSNGIVRSYYRRKREA